MTVSAVKILQPGEIQGMPVDDTPLLVVPESAQRVFKDRAQRLEELAGGNVLADWIRFCVQLCEAQAVCAAQVAPMPVDIDRARESLRHGLPPLSISTWSPDAGWADARMRLADALDARKLTGGPAAALSRWMALTDAQASEQARACLEAREHEVNAEFAPFVGATLQLLWTVSASALAGVVSAHKGESALCPVCGSHPVASVVRTGNRDSHRYMVCTLCASEWYAPRARCTSCDTPKEVSLLGLTRDDAIQGECCDECHGYIKLIVQSREPGIEVIADDLATIELDLALAREGYQRTGRNLFFTSGSDGIANTAQADVDTTN